MADRAPRVLVAHPSSDLYGSDLQLVESVRALVGAGWTVTVTLPADGPLTPPLTAAGARVVALPVPVLRKALLRPRGALTLVRDVLRSVVPCWRLLRSTRPDAVYVNTVTVPSWLPLARALGVPALVHVHEAESDLPRWQAWVLNAPLLLATSVVVNSNAARDALLGALPRLGARTTVVHNGVPGPPAEPRVEPRGTGPATLVLVGRLAPRKGSDVAVEATALLRARGLDVDLELHGTVFPGYEWFEDELRERAARPDLAGHVRLAGYTSPTWPVLDRADVVLVPSRAEPFGNVAVEGQLARRPVVASAVQGLREIVTDRRTGRSVPPGDPTALADAVEELLRDPDSAAALADAGRDSAVARFGIGQYQESIVARVAAVAGRRRR
ncbi:glycosyltransferase [Modestobacter sp. Leaf380]|uniref:glycosyltransferase n=1 Tax=Modestobacter sp. Leaf380 TaxID=1736356 RepID=UPI0006FC0475|nr:glycosyltransferase [Modestobacter sp. Leaf380]KQS68790.1 glycosyl transferase family 1 [Modestobacter sp. Leaf380]